MPGMMPSASSSQHCGHQGLGEIGIIGTAAAIANTVYHAPASASAICRSHSNSCCRETTYGMCTNCGQAIPEKRLEALPWASLCVTCEQERGTER
jgi:hypothetical protein